MRRYLALTVLLLAACRSGGGGPPQPPRDIIPVQTDLGIVGVYDCRPGDPLDVDAFVRHFHRDLDAGCRPQYNVRSVETEGRLVVNCNRALLGLHGFFERPWYIEVRREQDIRHERDHWLAYRVGLPCDLDHADDFCCPRAQGRPARDAGPGAG